MNQNQRIDILLATYNANEKYLKQQIESLINQTYKNIKIIISDDCSKNPQIRRILDEYEEKDDRIVVFYQQKNIGFNKNFWFLLEKSYSDYIMFCDQDDIWYNNKVEKSLEKMKKSDVSMVYTNCRQIDEKENVLHKNYFRYKNVPRIKGKSHLAISRCVGIGCSQIITKDVKEKMLPYKQSVRAHDWLAAFIANEQNGIDYIRKPLFDYRLHSNNVFGGRGFSQNLDKWKKENGDSYKSYIEYRRNVIETAYSGGAKMCLDYVEERKNKLFIKKLLRYYRKVEKTKILNIHFIKYFNFFAGRGLFKKMVKEIVLFHLPLLGYLTFKFSLKNNNSYKVKKDVKKKNDIKNDIKEEKNYQKEIELEKEQDSIEAVDFKENKISKKKNDLKKKIIKFEEKIDLNKKINNLNKKIDLKKRIIKLKEKINLKNIFNNLNEKFNLKKIFNMRNVKKTFQIIKKDGIKNTINKIRRGISRISFENNMDKDYEEYLLNFNQLEELQKKRLNYEPKISVVVPMYNTPYKFFEELVNSLIKQTYTNWELCLADGSHKQSAKLEKICKKDDRLRYKYLKDNKGIAGNTNEAIKMAKGEFIALLDHDDLLPRYSLYEIAKCINENPKVEFIYTDEDKFTTVDGPRFSPHFKPDFSLDFLRANNYICHFSVIKKDLINKLNGERDKYDGAQDFDLVLRVAENTNKIIHIPKVLYSWRVHPESTSQAEVDSKPYAYEAGITAIQDHLDRLNFNGTVEYGATLGTYRVKYEVTGNPKVTIIIVKKDGDKYLDGCLQSIVDTINYENYEIVTIDDEKETNSAVKHSNADYIVLLDSNVKMLTQDWLQDMLGFAQRREVGAVGAKIYYSNNKIKHAGIILEKNKVAVHIFRGLSRYAHGYFARESTIQNFSAVDKNCMMIKKSLFEAINGLEKNYDSKLMDLDLCLKIRQKNKNIVFNPFVELISYDKRSKTDEEYKNLKGVRSFLKKWQDFYEKGDPYYNPNLSLTGCNYGIKIEKNNK